MFLLTKPSHDLLSQFLRQHQDVPYTYAEVGATRTGTPTGYSCDRRRVCLGRGREVFLRAKRNLSDWRMFPAKFAEVIWPGPIESGRVVATLFQAPGFWTVNPCRIVYAIDETRNLVEQFGFAYGTVGSHLAAGEERFLVEHDHSDDSVWYEVYCFSRAAHWLSKLAYPYFRIQQYRFRRLSALAMLNATRSSNERLAASSFEPVVEK